MEGFHLQARNIHLFIPVFLVAVAYTTLSTLGYSTMVEPLITKVFHHTKDLWGVNTEWPSYYEDLVIETRNHAAHLVAASTVYHLVTTFTTGPAVLAVTVSAAVTACLGKHRSSSSHALVSKLLASGDSLRGPFITALLGHVLHGVACRGAVSVFGLYFAFLRYTTNHGLLSIEFLLFVLSHLFALYMEVICTLAVVVSAAEPTTSCFYGVRALRQAWWIAAEKTTPAVILVFVKVMVNAVMTISIRVVYVYSSHHYYTMAYAPNLSGFVSISLCAALHLWFVCATTTYYYQCRQRKNMY